MIYVFLANGFEEIEAITPIDVLRRAEKKVVIVGVGTGLSEITGAHGIKVSIDAAEAELEFNSELEMIVLPGGMPGTLNLKNSTVVQSAVKFCMENNRYIGAICAAPSILGELGVLKNKTAVCYPGFEDSLKGAKLGVNFVEADKNIITAKGAGVSMEFSLKLVELLEGAGKANKIRDAMQCKV